MWIWIRLRIRILLSSSKNSGKTRDCYCLYDFLSLKNYVNVASKSDQRYGYPDPYQNVTDPRQVSALGGSAQSDASGPELHRRDTE
jgi:hypothetical protein